jgi:hypothetical protein
MPADPRSGGEDPAELVAQVSALKRELLLRVHRHRLSREDLEDCFSQATLELISRARTRARAFHELDSDGVAAAFPPMQEPGGSRSRAGRRLVLVPSGRPGHHNGDARSSDKEGGLPPSPAGPFGGRGLRLRYARPK